MLREILNVRQIPNDPRRRWFSSEHYDLIVWYSNLDSPTGFQLCYNVGEDEKALTWQAPATFSHMGVDDGEGRPLRYKGTPILVVDGEFDAPSVINLFREESKNLPQDIKDLIVSKLTQYSHHERQNGVISLPEFDP